MIQHIVASILALLLGIEAVDNRHHQGEPARSIVIAVVVVATIVAIWL